MYRHAIFGLSLVFTQALAAESAQQTRERVYEDALLKMRLIARTPQQVAAFYEGRGFPPRMIELIASKCFITVGIRNKSADILWHELERWRFTGTRGRIDRVQRAWWKAQWRAMNAPMPSQSTFRWTLLPERLDFRPDEAEGGNLVLPREKGPFTLEAYFLAGADRAGEAIRARLENLHCAEDEDTIFEFLAAVAPELASLADRDGLVTEGWQPRGLPASYLVDPGGRLRFQALGGLPWDEAPYIDFLERISIRDE